MPSPSHSCCVLTDVAALLSTSQRSAYAFLLEHCREIPAIHLTPGGRRFAYRDVDRVVTRLRKAAEVER